MHTKQQNSIYRLGVGAMIIKDQQVFIAQRNDDLQAWQMPQGGLESGESYQDALQRELLEEIGYNQFPILGYSDKLTYQIPEYLRRTLWGGNYIGQEQIWYFLDGNQLDNKHIDLTAYHTQEFIAWRFADCQQVLALAVEFKQLLYQNLFEIAKQQGYLNS